MAYEQTEKRNEIVFSKKVRAGKRRTYFFDVKSTKSNDYFLTITESIKHFDNNSYERHKLFLYKEDFNKFVKALGETVDHIKTELMPNFDFDAFNHEEYENNESHVSTTSFEDKPVVNHTTNQANHSESVDKW